MLNEDNNNQTQFNNINQTSNKNSLKDDTNIIKSKILTMLIAGIFNEHIIE